MPDTIHAAAAEIRRGRLTPLQLLEDCLARLERYEPAVRAWVLIDRDGARAEAARATEEIRRGGWRGPVHGIPLGIKDIIDAFAWPTAPGPIGRCVRDLALVLQYTAGPDPLDPTCADRAVPDYLAALDAPPTAPRLGRLRGLFDDQADATMRAFLDASVEKLRRAGATV